MLTDLKKRGILETTRRPEPSQPKYTIPSNNNYILKPLMKNLKIFEVNARKK